MANEKRLIYLEDAISLFEQDIEENKVALRTAYHGEKEIIRAEINGMRIAISLVNSLARNGFTVDAVEVVHSFWDDSGRYVFPSGRKAICCDACKCALSVGEYNRFKWNYCPVCGAKMDGDGNG